MSGTLDLSNATQSVERALTTLFRRGTLTVSSGVHAGAEHPIDSTGSVIGSGVDDDIVLLGSSLAAGHARLSLCAPLGDRLRIEADGGPVEIVSVGTVPHGRSSDVALPAVIRMGGAEFRVTGSAFSRFVPPRFAVALIIGSVASFSLAVSAASLSDAFDRGRPPIVTAALAPAQVLPLSEAEVRVRSLLAEAGLGERITVKVEPDGVITLRGAVAGSRSIAAWRGALQAIDMTPGLPHVVHSVTVSTEEPRPPTVASVWLGSAPYVLLRDGSRIAVGEATGDGWQVVAIEEGAILFRNSDGEEMRASFRRI